MIFFSSKASSIKRWRPHAKLCKMLVVQGFQETRYAFEIIKQGKTCLCRRLAALYFYIINGSDTEKRERKEQKRTSFHTNFDLTFFFIWQAIVRGQLFLQWTFFYALK
jgi:hypothetical protein